MKAYILLCLLLSTSCTKDRVELRRPIVDVTGRMVALEITFGDRTIHDTIIGQMVYGGGITVDTMQGTGRYNLSLNEGEGMTVRVAHLRTPATDGEACIKVFGDTPAGSLCSADSIVSLSL